MSDETASSGLVFTIGLTGHRDIHPEAMAGVREALRNELLVLKSSFKSLPVELVTGLAEGADTLATEVALEIGMPVRVVLPMPRSLYEPDFEDAALDDFRRLVTDDRIQVQELPLPPGTSEVEITSGASRDELYARLMDYLVRRSNVLVALWDGEVTGLTGGSSDVVTRYLADSGLQSSEAQPFKMTNDAALADDQSDVVIWIKTLRHTGSIGDRSAQTSFLVQAGATGVACRLPSLPEALQDRWRDFDQYAHERDSETGRALPVYPMSEPGDSRICEIAEAIDGDFNRADQLAMANQSQSDRLFKLFGLMAALMGLAFLLYAKIAALKFFLIAYVGLFALGFLLFAVGNRRGWFGRHLAFRALAETLRVRFFMVLSGSGSAMPTRRLFQLTSVDRFKGFGWICDAIRCTEPLTYESNVSLDERVSAASQRWVMDQAQYFSRKRDQLHKQHERLETVKKGLFLAAFLGAVSLLFFKKILYDFHIYDLDGKTLVVFLMGLLPLWLAIWEIYQTKMATRELLWQYANQSERFEMAQIRLGSMTDPKQKQSVIFDLAERSLMDVIQWSTHRYHREHEPPSAG